MANETTGNAPKLKDNQQIAPEIAADGSRVTFHVRGMEPLTLDMAKLHPDILARAAAVGMAQVRIIDAAAVGRTDADGMIIPQADLLAEKRRRMAALIEHYESGTAEWSRRREGGAGGAIAGITLRAVAEVQGVTPEVMRVRIDELAEKRGIEAKALLRKLATSTAVAAKIAEMKAAAAKGGADVDSLLGELAG